MKLKKYNQLFEKDIKKTKGIPSEYIQDVERKAEEEYGTSGPSPMEIREMMETMNSIMEIQDGNEDKLTEIGKNIIMKYYGKILDDVELDIKIVKPNDEEKSEMVDKMLEEPEEEIEEIEINDVEDIEVDKRKILNNIMQGESQNVQSMMYDARKEIDEIDEYLLDLYKRMFEINKKIEWEGRMNLEDMMRMQPEMANAMSTDWDDENEEGESKPIIKVRSLDLPMLIHETVKGIYELIMANAIPEDEQLAKKIMRETDTLPNEQQDVKYGPYIAADIRNYITHLLERKHDETDIENVKEFIYGRMVEIPSDDFIELIRRILTLDMTGADKIMKKYDILYQSILDAKGEVDVGTYSVNIPQESEDESEDEMLKPKEKDYSEMSKKELDNLLNVALDNEDYETAKKIQEYL